MHHGAALAGGIGSALSVLAAPRHLMLAGLYLLALLPSAAVLVRKAQQTRAALDLFDRALVLTHWPLYAAALRDIEGGAEEPLG